MSNPGVGLAAPLDSAGSSASLGSVAPAPEVPRLASVDNFRDIAGPDGEYVGPAGLHVNRGVFYRSNSLTPTPEDLATLESLSLSRIYDLRTDLEISSRPDVLPAGVSYTQIDVTRANPGDALGGVKSPDDARAMLAAGYRSMASDEYSRARFGEVLTELATTEGAQLFHCTAGKDRTGWVSALLLSLAGVERETIIKDYLLTNDYAAASIQATLDQVIATAGPEAAEMYRPLLGVEESYLRAAFGEVDRHYSSIESYIVDGLGVSPLNAAILKGKLLL